MHQTSIFLPTELTDLISFNSNMRETAPPPVLYPDRGP